MVLHFRALQINVNYFLARKLSYDVKVSPSEKARIDLAWWASCGPSLPLRSLSHFSEDITLFYFARNSGLDAWSSTLSTYGKWSPDEWKQHINIKELKSVLYAFLPLFRSTFSCSILIRSDNSTIVSYINKQGGTSCSILCCLALELWQLCVNLSINILAVHIAGELNIRTDKLSLLEESDHDYFLSSSMFSSLSKAISFPLKVDLFANRLNYKIPNYIY